MPSQDTVQPRAAQVGPAGDDLLEEEIRNALAALISHLLAQGADVARLLGIPAVFIKALHLLDGPMAMKELGRRMNCDPSFITGIADMLEQRGLATRESDPTDRRVKRLVLTPAGERLKQHMEEEVRARMPWRTGLGRGERECLLGLIRKMLLPGREPGGSAGLPASMEGPGAAGGEHHLTSGHCGA